jgi:hypothetical protein
MVDVGLFLLVVWIIKNAAEDTYTTVKGQSNPRIERRRQRQRSRANNPIWTQFVGWLGDLAEDARTEAARSRQEKRERQERDRERRRAERETAEVEPAAQPEPATAEVTEPEAVPVPQTPNPEPEVDLDLDDPKEERPDPSGSETTSPAPDPLPDNVIPFARPAKFDPKEHDMSSINGEVTGLDPAISYAKSLAMFAGEHGQAGNEGYIGFLQSSQVEGAALQSAAEMQAAFAAAQEAAQRHQKELEKQKPLQEGYNTNPDAGNKAFMQNGQ